MDGQRIDTKIDRGTDMINLLQWLLYSVIPLLIGWYVGVRWERAEQMIREGKAMVNEKQE